MPRAILPAIESLERRDYFSASSVFVTPMTATLDATHFHTFADAYAASTPGGAITILDGAPIETNTFALTLANLVIQGDPNISVLGLPRYNFTLGASGITLVHLALGALVVAQGFGLETVHRCDILTVTIAGGSATGNGFNSFDSNVIHDGLAVAGASGAVMSNDSFTHNTISTFSVGYAVNVSNDNGFNFTDNTIHNDDGAIGGIFFTGMGVTVSRNVIYAGYEAVGISVSSSATSGTVSDNVISAGDPLHGIGMTVYVFATDGVALRVEGNDFTHTTTGLEYNGLTGATTISVDFGGGSQGSLGGNNFRTYTGLGGSQAIIIAGVTPGATLYAMNNLFKTGSTGSNVVQALAGTIQTSALSATQALIANLYETLLKRVPKAADYTYWSGVYGASGQAAVVNGIARSTEALTDVVHQNYEEFLGRMGAAAEASYWVGRIQAGMTLAAVQAAMLASTEFIAGHNADFVQSLYRSVLHRTADAGSITYWYGQLGALGLTGVASAIVNSAENQSNQIVTFFATYLHRAATAGDLAYFLTLNIDALTLESQIFSSAEYLTRG